MPAASELVVADDPAVWAALGFAPDDAGRVVLGPLAVRLAGPKAGTGTGIVALVLDGEVRGEADGLPLRGTADPAGRAASAGAADACGSADRSADRSASAGAADPAASAGAADPAASAGAADPRASAGAADPSASAAADSAAHPNGAVAIDHAVVLTDSRDRTAAALVAAGGDERRRGGPPELPARMAFVRFGALIVEVAEAPGGPPRFWGLTVTVTDIDAAAARVGRPPRDAVQPGRRILTIPREAGLSIALALITPRPAPPASAARG